MQCKLCNLEIPITRYSKRKDVKFCSQYCNRKSWSLENKDKDRASKAKYLLIHPDRRKESSKAYMQRNKPYYAQYSSLRRRQMECAKPSWVDEKVLIWFYEEAAYFGLEVDHIIPISHKKVCGLHVPWNLQLLTRQENAVKSNKFDEDCVAKIKKEKTNE